MAVKVIGTLLLISMSWFTTLLLAASPEVHDASRQLYDRVMEEFKHGDYEAALAGFRLFMELHRQSSLAPNAQYWIGECQYRLGRYTDALNSFDSVRSYPANPKLAASAFKIGQTYSRLGEHQKARQMFDRVLEEYPNGAEAELARKALTVMSAQH